MCIWDEFAVLNCRSPSNSGNRQPSSRSFKWHRMSTVCIVAVLKERNEFLSINSCPLPMTALDSCGYWWIWASLVKVSPVILIWGNTSQVKTEGRTSIRNYYHEKKNRQTWLVKRQANYINQKIPISILLYNAVIYMRYITSRMAHIVPLEDSSS